MVVVHTFEEFAEQCAGSGRTRCNPQLVQVGALEAERLQRWNPGAHAGRSPGQSGDMRQAVVVAQMVRLHQRLPGLLVGRENGIGCAGSRQQLAPLQHHLVLHRMHRNADAGQRAQDPAIALDRLRLVVMRGKNRLHTEFERQRDDRRRGIAVHHDQSGVRVGAGAAQLRVQFQQRVADEFDPAVGTRQRVENSAVKHERAMHLAAGNQCQVQRRVVVQSQVASQPHETGIELFAHSDRKIAPCPTRPRPST